MQSLVPMLPVKHLPRAVEFYEKLGFIAEDRNDDWGWAKMSLDGCSVMLDQSIHAGERAAKNSVIYLYPDDVEDYHSQVRSRGLEIPALERTFYGMTEFRLTDPDGNQIWIGQASS